MSEEIKSTDKISKISMNPEGRIKLLVGKIQTNKFEINTLEGQIKDGQEVLLWIHSDVATPKQDFISEDIFGEGHTLENLTNEQRKFLKIHLENFIEILKWRIRWLREQILDMARQLRECTDQIAGKV